MAFRPFPHTWIGLGVLCWSAAGAGAEAPKLSLPIECVPQKTCFIQDFVDTDPGSAAVDFTCGPSTYDGHTGTDFRVLSAAATDAGIPVLAAADGAVKKARDGVEDKFVTAETREEVMSIGCGNAVLIGHEGDLDSLYCHLRNGSVLVKPGDAVKRGQPIGKVGYSGLADFAHLHFELLSNGKRIDPFTGAGADAGCQAGNDKAQSLWEDGAVEKFGTGGSAIIQSGFTVAPPTREALELNHVVAPPPKGVSRLLFFARVINIRMGDRMKITLEGPKGFKYVNDGKPLEKFRPRHLEWATAGTSGSWPLPNGIYEGRAELIRDGKVIATRRDSFAVTP